MATAGYLLLSLIQCGQRPFWERPRYLHLGYNNGEINEHGRTERCDEHVPVPGGCILQYKSSFYLLTAANTPKLSRDTFRYLASQRPKSDNEWLVMASQVYVDKRLGYVVAKLDPARLMENENSLKQYAVYVAKGYPWKMPNHRARSERDLQARVLSQDCLRDVGVVEVQLDNGEAEGVTLPQDIRYYSLASNNSKLRHDTIGSWIWDDQDGSIKGFSVGVSDSVKGRMESGEYVMGFKELGLEMQDTIWEALEKLDT
jgi:hypothetical protein